MSGDLGDGRGADPFQPFSLGERRVSIAPGVVRFTAEFRKRGHEAVSVTRPRQVTLVDEARPRPGGDPVLRDRLDDCRTGAEPRTWPDSNVQAGRRLERTADRKQGTPKLHEPKGPV